MIDILIVTYLAVYLFAAWETFYDHKLIELFDGDGQRTKLENMMLHSGQLLPRGLLILMCSAFYGYAMSSMLVLILCFVSLSFFYWLVFDIMFNVFILKKNWLYVGKTSSMDRKVKWLEGFPLLAIKLTGFILPFILILP